MVACYVLKVVRYSWIADMEAAGKSAMTPILCMY